mgnify:CR=1 FL=1
MGSSVVVCPVRASGWVRGVIHMAAISALAIFAGPALAQPTAQQVADRAIAEIQTATQNASAALEAGKTRAVAEIERLDLAGAPDRRIVNFGQAAVEALQRMGQAGRGRIETIARNAVVALHRLNAPQELIDNVLRAAQEGRQAITQAQQRSVNQVRAAVAEAIGPP